MKKSRLLILALILGVNILPQAQTKAADSVVINVGEKSKITVVIKDKKDLETLKSYNFQSLMNDIINKVETKDTVTAMKTSDNYLKQSTDTQTPIQTPTQTEENWNRPDSKESLNATEGDIVTNEKKRYRGTRQSISFDLGTSNYLLADNKFPDADNDLYAVRP